MGMTAFLLNIEKAFEQNDNTHSTKGRKWHLVKIGRSTSEKKIIKYYEIWYMYIAQG